jgi:hypothetical protein
MLEMSRILLTSHLDNDKDDDIPPSAEEVYDDSHLLFPTLPSFTIPLKIRPTPLLGKDRYVVFAFRRIYLPIPTSGNGRIRSSIFIARNLRTLRPNTTSRILPKAFACFYDEALSFHHHPVMSIGIPILLAMLDVT